MECRLQLTEVYDIATTVGKEFQHLIEEFGGSSISKLVSTVLGALEHLEFYVEECEKLQAQYYKLLLENDSLASEKEERIRLASEKEVSSFSSMSTFSAPPTNFMSMCPVVDANIQHLQH